MTTATESELIAPDGTRLFVRDWSVNGDDGPKALAVVVHGLGEHAGRYEHLADKLSGMGCAVRGADHRGHGRSSGLRGHVDGFSQYTGDMNHVIESFRETHGKDLPCFLIGQSMGGLLTLQYLIERPEAGLSGAVLSNPCLGLAVKAPAAKLFAGRALARLLPRLRMDNELNTDHLSRDPQAVQAYVNDPLVHRHVSTRWYTSLLAAMDHVNGRARDVQVPTLWVIGDQDQICSPAVSDHFAQQLPKGRVDISRWPEAYHEPHNGPDSEAVLTAISSWLRDQTDALSQSC
ncbi:MAG TPA: hypothetical protein DIU15_02295 [Deltaproteobacteria bacterium]|nr:hypothetical protein [Deltaproteobacteria bacterium]HCP44849.1 hypothetical protein [Deltaproteobacteria bacterium]